MSRTFLAAISLWMIAGICPAQTRALPSILAELKAVYGNQAAAAPAENENAPPPPKLCVTTLLMELQMTLPQLTPAEQEQIAALDPTLKRMVDDSRRPVSRTQIPGSPLPTGFEYLEDRIPGKRCIIHYTTTHAPDICTDAFAFQVTEDIDKAIRILGSHFGKAIPCGTDGKVHVYIHNLRNAQNVATADAITHSGSAPIFPDTRIYSFWMDVRCDQMADDVAHWEVNLAGVCFHEYMHAVQFAHNANSFLPDRWMKEGQATWIESLLEPDDVHLRSFLMDNKSVAKQPDLAIWDPGVLTEEERAPRPYTCALFMFYLASRYGFDVMDRWLEQTEKYNDAMQALQAALATRKDPTGAANFATLYRGYLVALLEKKIRHVDPAIIPDVPKAGFGELPVEDFHEGIIPGLAPTGAVFYDVEPDNAQTEDFIVGSFSSVTGNPEAILVQPSGRATLVRAASPFAQTSVSHRELTYIILTDTHPGYQTPDLTTFEAQFFTPHIEVTQITPPTAAISGSAMIPITYNLTGLPMIYTSFDVEFAFAVSHVAHPTLQTLHLTPGTGKTAMLPLAIANKGTRPQTHTVHLHATTPTGAYYGVSIRGAQDTFTSAPFTVTVAPTGGGGGFGGYWNISWGAEVGDPPTIVAMNFETSEHGQHVITFDTLVATNHLLYGTTWNLSGNRFTTSKAPDSVGLDHYYALDGTLSGDGRSMSGTFAVKAAAGDFALSSGTFTATKR